MCRLHKNTWYLLLAIVIVGLGFYTAVLYYQSVDTLNFKEDNWNGTCSFGRDDRKIMLSKQLTGKTDMSVNETECKEYAADRWGNNRINGYLASSNTGFKYCDYKYKSTSPFVPLFTTNQLGCTETPDLSYCMQVCKTNNLKYSSFNNDPSDQGFLTCRCANSNTAGATNHYISTGIFDLDASYTGDTKGCYIVPEYTDNNGNAVSERVYYSPTGGDCSSTRICVVKKLTGVDTRLIHCGHCGQCSTEQDANVLYTHSNTLTDQLKKCSVYELAGGQIDTCVDKNLDFTENCKACYKENIKCTKQHCEFECGYEVFMDIEPSKNGNPSKCVACFENSCGEQFRSCAGITRQRAGLITELERQNVCSYNIKTEMINKGYN